MPLWTCVSGIKDNQAIKSQLNWYYLSLGVVLAYFLSYTFFYWVVFTLGLFSSLGILLYCAILLKAPRITNRVHFSSKFKFVNSADWGREIRSLSIDKTEIQQPIFEESFLVSEAVEEFINLLVDQFVGSWFQSISDDRKFHESIKSELIFVFKNLKNRIENLNLAKFLVSKIFPILTEHFRQYVKAEDSVKLRGTFNKVRTDTIEFDAAVARSYDRGKIHQAVTLTNSGSSDINQKRYLRNKVGSIIPFLLSENENASDISTSFIKEILACTILSNIVDMVSEGDFYNLLIQKFIGDNLKHRNQVKQLRAALEEHSQQLTFSPPSIKSIRSVRSAKRIDNSFTIKESMDTKSFKEVLKKASRIDSETELEQIQSHILFQLKNIPQSVKSNSMVTFEKRLNVYRAIITDQLSKCNSNFHSSLINNGKLAEFVENLELSDILNNPRALDSFSEFLGFKKKSNLLELWRAIDLMKAPLEDSAIGLDGENKLALSLEFSNSEDIKFIYDTFFHKQDLNIDPKISTVVKEFIDCKTLNKTDLYQKARISLLKLQANTYQILDECFFLSFKKSTFFSKLLDINAFHINFESLNNSTFSINSNINSAKDKSISPNSETYPIIIKAVEDAFTEIMKSSRKDTNEFKSNDSYAPSSELSLQEYSDGNMSTIDMKKDLFGDASSLFDDTSFVGSSGTSRYSKLFADESEGSETDSDSLNFDSDTPLMNSLDLEHSNNSDSQLFLAAPGNLSLSEEIFKLNHEIEKLEEQKAILSPLIKKAELTNNITELKILKKSRLSLEREMNSKELQKQQYIVQESDNSLFGKSTVRIQSYISGNENGKEFILYIVEVQKFSNDNPDIITAGWVVARRYSQFFKLNEYLKSKYYQIANIKFPKRTVSVLSFQQRQIIEIRKATLEEYLRELIQIPEICSNKAFRTFLSSENFSIRKNQTFEENTLSHKYPKSNVELVANKLYKGISNRLLQNQNIIYNETTPDGSMSENLKEIQKELKQFDENSNVDSKQVFVKPICDLLIAIFKLNSSKSWLRGRALLVILQQIFGTTIEKKVYEQTNIYLRTEESILDIVVMLKETIFPNGKFRDPPALRSSFDRSATKQEAKILLGIFMNETCSKIFGSSNTIYAYTKIFKMIQNDFLNKHLHFEILDVVLNEIFPEIHSEN